MLSIVCLGVYHPFQKESHPKMVLKHFFYSFVPLKRVNFNDIVWGESLAMFFLRKNSIALDNRNYVHSLFSSRISLDSYNVFRRIAGFKWGN